MRNIFLLMVFIALAMTLFVLHTKAQDKVTIKPMKEEGEVLWITVPDIMKDIGFSFDRYYIVPAREDSPEKIVNEIEIVGKVGGLRGEIRLGIFEDDVDAKAGCDRYLSSCAASAMPLMVGLGKPAKTITIGDESWRFGSAIMFLKGRTLCQVSFDGETTVDDHLNLARAMADAIHSHSTPHVIVTSEGQPPKTEDDSAPAPSIQCTKVHKSVIRPKGKEAKHMWRADLRIVGADTAKLFCFEFRQGCLVYGRTIVATRGEVQVWGNSTKAKYLGGPGKVMMRPAVGVGEKLRWGVEGEFTIGREIGGHNTDFSRFLHYDDSILFPWHPLRELPSSFCPRKVQ